MDQVCSNADLLTQLFDSYGCIPSRGGRATGQDRTGQDRTGQQDTIWTEGSRQLQPSHCCAAILLPASVWCHSGSPALSCSLILLPLPLLLLLPLLLPLNHSAATSIACQPFSSTADRALAVALPLPGPADPAGATLASDPIFQASPLPGHP